MGRKDAVQFTLEWAAEARRLGAIVDFEPGWETRGNGTSANYEGGVVHHTAFLSSAGNPFPAKNTLKAGRPDLSGPLCNVGGPWCEDGAPRLVVIAAHPANHAGASGGKSMGPLPVTSLFNPRVFGLEIDYGGVVPMTKGQRKAATIFSRALVNVLGRSSEYVRAHAETSITGKWDPGYANGKTIDMGEFRQGVANFSTSEEDDMSKQAEDEIHQIWNWIRDEGNAGPQNMLQAILSAVRGNNPSGRNNFHWLANVVTAAVAEGTQQVLAATAGGVKVDASVVRVAIEEATTQAIAKAVADEQDRRERDGDPATGSVS